MASEPLPYLTVLGFLHAAVDMLGLALGFYAVTHGEILAGLICFAVPGWSAYRAFRGGR